MIKINDFSENSLNIIKSIERRAYEGTSYAQMQDIRDIGDLASYCESEDIDLYLSYDATKDEGIYMLIAEHDDSVEIVDFAKTEDFSGIESGMFILRALKELDRKGKEITLDARESTSYPILCGLAEKGLIDITNDEPYDWDGETFHEMEFTVTLSRERENDYGNR